MDTVKSVRMKYEEKGEGDFSVNTDDKRTKSLWFSVRSLFNTLTIDRKKFKPQKFIPEIIDSNEGKIFVIEINKKGII